MVRKIGRVWRIGNTGTADFEISISSNPSGLSRETLLNMLMTGQESSRVEDMDYLLSKVLRMLENDGYIMKKEAVRVFRSPLLRDYWFNTFVQ